MSVDSFEFLLAEVMKYTTFYRNVMATIGVVIIAKKVINVTVDVVCGLKTFTFGRIWPIHLKKMGTWAVVTGPTSGIGKAFAIEFARRGLNVALLGRNLEKMNDISNYLTSSYKVDTKIIITDFADNALSYETVINTFESMNVAVCVNNVGVITEYPSYIFETSDKDINDMINVNIKSVTMMTKIAVSHMQKKKCGLIVNISSMSATGPTPLMAVYAATKAYVSSFSRAVNAEVKSSGVMIQTLTPSYVKTRMIGYSPELNASWFVPSAPVYVKHAMYTLGYSNHTTGYWLHGLMDYLLSLFPACTWINMTRRTNIYFREKYKGRHED